MKVVAYKWENSGPQRSHGYLTGPILRLLPPGDNLRIADLGCGNGFLAGILAGMGHEVTALDSSEDGIRIAREQYPSVKVHCLSLYDDIEKTIDKGFDAVISSEVIEHLYDPRTFLNNAHKILKDGGTLILTAPYHGYLKNLALALTGRLDAHFTVGWDGGHIKFFSVKTLRDMVSEQGFKKVRYKFAGRLPFLWKSMILCAEK